MVAMFNNRSREKILVIYGFSSLFSKACEIELDWLAIINGIRARSTLVGKFYWNITKPGD